MLTFELMDEEYSICRLSGVDEVPGWAAGPFVSVTRTPDELSIVCPALGVPGGIHQERGWRCFRIAGPLDLSLVGILASVTSALAAADVNVFAIGTYDTDYLLVKESLLEQATQALQNAGHDIRRRTSF